MYGLRVPQRNRVTWLRLAPHPSLSTGLRRAATHLSAVRNSGDPAFLCLLSLSMGDAINFNQRFARDASGSGNRRPDRGLRTKFPLEYLIHAVIVFQVIQVYVNL